MSSLTALSSPTLQAIAFPFLILVIWRVKVFGQRTPLRILLLSLVCAAVVSGFGYSSYVLERNGFLVAQLADDPQGIKSRIFRERINAAIRQSAGKTFGGRAAAYHSRLETPAEAAAVFDSGKPEWGIAWGDSRWLNLSLPWREPIELHELSEAVAGIGALKIVSSVPVIGLSFEPSGDTARFLALLFVALRDKGSLPDRDAELYLREALTSEAFWTSFSHRAYPALLLGNMYMRMSLQRSDFEGGYIAAALRSYDQGLSFLRGNDNPELSAALLNNKGVALAVAAHFQADKRLGKLAVQELRRAFQAISMHNRSGLRFRAPRLAKYNMTVLRDLRLTDIKEEADD